MAAFPAGLSLEAELKCSSLKFSTIELVVENIFILQSNSSRCIDRAQLSHASCGGVKKFPISCYSVNCGLGYFCKIASPKKKTKQKPVDMK